MHMHTHVPECARTTAHTHKLPKTWHTTPIPCFTNVTCPMDTMNDDECEDAEHVNGILKQDMNKIEHHNLYLKS